MLSVAFPLKTPRMVRNRLQFEGAGNPWQARGFIYFTLRLVTRPSVEPGKFFDRRTGKAEFKTGIGAGCSQIRRSHG
jgi:hypothetical protein